MKLRVDTSDNFATKITFLKEGKIIDQIVKKREKRSQVVLEAISELLSSKNLKITDVDELEVCLGHGSFTGLRVGVTIANTLQFLLEIPLNGVVGPVEPVYE